MLPSVSKENKVPADDTKFFQKIISEFTNVDLNLQRYYDNVINSRDKIQNLRSSLSSQCIPMFIEIKDKTEEKNMELESKIKELKTILDSIDGVLYKEPLLKFQAKHK